MQLLLTLARNSDPISSHDAIPSRDKLERQQKLILDAVKRYPGSTAKEIDGRLFGQVESHKRLASLADRGYIVTGERRKCRVTGMSVLTYWSAT